MFFFLRKELYPTRLDNCVMTLHMDDVGFQEQEGAPPPHDDDNPAEQPKKRRRYATRLITASTADFLKNLGLENCATNDRGLYAQFCEELVTKGDIIWRMHSDSGDVVVMNDISSTSGRLQPLSFCHVSSATQDDQLLINCTCQMYRHIKSVAMGEGVDVAEDDAILDDKFTCVHCRLYRDLLHPDRNLILSGNTGSQVVTKVQENLTFLNNPVVLLGPASSTATTKLSVVGQNKTSTVHLTFTPAGNCFARCQLGTCSMYHLNKKKVPKTADSRCTDGLCSHLKTLFANLEFVYNLFPGRFGEGYGQGEGGDDVDLEVPVPFPPTDATPSSKVTFDTESGLWQSSSYSQHKPMSQHCPQLVKRTFHRLQFFRDGPDVDGAFKGPDLYPALQDENGKDVMCMHQNKFTSDEHPVGLVPQQHFRCKVYTCQVCRFDCIHTRFDCTLCRFNCTLCRFNCTLFRFNCTLFTFSFSITGCSLLSVLQAAINW